METDEHGFGRRSLTRMDTDFKGGADAPHNLKKLVSKFLPRLA
jgi:hypothetical protein